MTAQKGPAKTIAKRDIAGVFGAESACLLSFLLSVCATINESINQSIHKIKLSIHQSINTWMDG